MSCILNRTQGEKNFATLNAIFGIDVNDIKCLNHNGTLLADHYLDPQSIPRVMYSKDQFLIQI